jgi:hypothetical protein
MQVSSTVKNRQTTSGYLVTLFLRHQSAATHYLDIANALKDREGMITLTKSLATYHGDRAAAIESMLNDMAPVPVKPNVDMKDEVPDVAPKDMNNDMSLLKNYQAREEAILKYYSSMLDNDGIPPALHKQLQSISEHTQEVVRKLQRTISSGSVERDMTV